MQEQKSFKFPKDFLWGASVSAHQVEGSNHNQWTVWELAHAAQLARNAENRYSHLPIWSEIKNHAQNPENYVSGQGVDHYNCHKQDFDIAGQLNLNALRFGIEWSRLEPEEGQWDEAAVDYYQSYIRELKKRGMMPVLNIWHWTFPTWFASRGGFKKGSNLKYWRRFITKISEEYGAELRYVITINEPNVYATHSYTIGLWPPQEKNYLSSSFVVWNMVRAHRQAYKILKSAHPKLQIGIASQLANIQAKRPHNFIDEISTKFMRYFWNWWFLNRVKRYQDFIGFNYYFSDYYTGLLKRKNPHVPQSDLGWYMEPEGLYPLLLRAWTHYKKPIIVTENGVADMHDQYRRWWIEETIVAMERAISEGVDVKGYFHWSLLDNFEWADGWWPKFGLVAVDREHGMKRNVRDSAKWFAQRIEDLQKGT